MNATFFPETFDQDFDDVSGSGDVNASATTATSHNHRAVPPTTTGLEWLRWNNVKGASVRTLLKSAKNTPWHDQGRINQKQCSRKDVVMALNLEVPVCKTWCFQFLMSWNLTLASSPGVTFELQHKKYSQASGKPVMYELHAIQEIRSARHSPSSVQTGTNANQRLRISGVISTSLV